MMRVWWTVPDSAVAWEWRPTIPKLFDATRIVTDDGSQYLRYTEEMPGPPFPYMGLPAGQPLADTTALFAQEANLVPKNLLITWIEGRRAVRWDRTVDGWTEHEVSLREEDQPVVGPSIKQPDIPEWIVLHAETYGTNPVKQASQIAMGLLGLTPISTTRDFIAQEVERNQSAIGKAVNALAEKLAIELRHEFPGWKISREDSGTWSAMRDGVGIVTASASSELREKLRKFYNGRK